MPHDASSLVGNARGLAADGVRAVRTRLELLGIEIQQEKGRVSRQLLVAAAALYLLSFGTLLGILWIVTSLPAAQRGVVLCGIALAFLAGGAGAVLWLRYGEARGKPLLATTVAVLMGDEQALGRTSR